jgi:hypothetical protein
VPRQPEEDHQAGEAGVRRGREEAAPVLRAVGLSAQMTKHGIGDVLIVRLTCEGMAGLQRLRHENVQRTTVSRGGCIEGRRSTFWLMLMCMGSLRLAVEWRAPRLC